MKREKVIKYFAKWYPSLAPEVATAKALGISRQAVNAWDDDVPKTSQALIELLSKGDIKRDKANG
jgi:hypothetical protein